MFKMSNESFQLWNSFLDYAKSIGVQFGEGACYDEMQCTSEQAQFLTDWWERNLNG